MLRTSYIRDPSGKFKGIRPALNVRLILRSKNPRFWNMQKRPLLTLQNPRSKPKGLLKLLGCPSLADIHERPSIGQYGLTADIEGKKPRLIA
jgi:hypothetical protein